MKKYLLIIACACLALSSFADDNAGVSKKEAATTSGLVSRKVYELDPNGGKPRRPIMGVGDLENLRIKAGTKESGSGGTGTYSKPSHADLVDNIKQAFAELGMDPLGGKPRVPVDPRKPTSSGGFANMVKGNINVSISCPSHVGQSDHVGIDDVTSLIDKLLTNQGNGKSIADVTRMIDRMLTGGTAQ